MTEHSFSSILLVPGIGGTILKARLGPPDKRQDVIVWPSLKKTEEMIKYLWVHIKADSSQIVNVENVEIFVPHERFGLEVDLRF